MNLCRWICPHLCRWICPHLCRWICPQPLLQLWSSVHGEGRRVAADSQTSASSIGRRHPPPPPPLLRWWAPSAEEHGYRQEVTRSHTNSPECKDLHLGLYKICLNSVFCILIFGNPVLFLFFNLLPGMKTGQGWKLRRIWPLSGGPCSPEEHFEYFMFKSINVMHFERKIKQNYKRVWMYNKHGHIMLYKKWDWQLVSWNAQL